MVAAPTGCLLRKSPFLRVSVFQLSKSRIIFPPQRLVKMAFMKYAYKDSFLPFQTKNAAGNWATWPNASHPHPLSSLHPFSFTEITRGFDPLPKALSASLKPGTIHLGPKVEVVVRDGPEVQISYQVGESNSAPHSLTADFVSIGNS